MPKSPSNRLTARMRASIGRPLPNKPQRRDHLGFANEYLEQLFRALAAVHPKGVRINDAGWRLVADEHVRVGLFTCTIDGAPPAGAEPRALCQATTVAARVRDPHPTARSAPLCACRSACTAVAY